MMKHQEEFKQILKDNTDLSIPFEEHSIVNSAIGKLFVENVFSMYVEEMDQVLKSSKKDFEVMSEMFFYLNQDEEAVYIKEQAFFKYVFNRLKAPLNVTKSVKFKKKFSQEVNRSIFLSVYSNHSFTKEENAIFIKLMKLQNKLYSAKIKEMDYQGFKLYFREATDRRIESNILESISFETKNGTLFLNTKEESAFLIHKDGVLCYASENASLNRMQTLIRYEEINGAKNNKQKKITFVYDGEHTKKTYKIVETSSGSEKKKELFDNKTVVAASYINREIYCENRRLSFCLIDTDITENYSMVISVLDEDSDYFGMFESLSDEGKNIYESILGEQSTFKDNDYKKENGHANSLFDLPIDYNEDTIDEFKNMFILNTKI